MEMLDYKKKKIREKELQDKIDSLQKELDSIRESLPASKVEGKLDYKKGKPFLLIKLGDKEKGWIPSQRHFDAVRKVITDSCLDEEYNILIFHYGIEFEVLNRPELLKKIKGIK